MACLALTAASAADPTTARAAAPAASALQGGPRQRHYQGTFIAEAHYRRPGDTRRYGSEQWYYTDGKGRVRLDWATWNEGDTTRFSESFLVIGDSVFNRNRPTSPWRLLAGERARLGRFHALAGLRSANHIEAHAHPRLGDVRDSVIIEPGRSATDTTTMLVVLHERDHQWRTLQRLVEVLTTAPPESLLATPTNPEPPESRDETFTDPPTLVQLAPGVWCAEMEGLDSRTLVVEFADHLAVAELAVGSKNGERLADALRTRWPGKPIRYALFSHHHPHYTGAARAMIAEGATIVATAGNEQFIRDFAARPFTIEPDRLARSPRAVSVRAFTGRTELADSTNRLVAIDFGPRSEHTDEFVVFWLPRQKLLFQSELGWVTRAGGALRPIRRAAAFLEWIAAEGLDVERIVQGWPMQGNERELTRARLAELVAEQKR
ncbi:MAG TPA: hypothetical protein VFM17_06820 [Candidatus Eisenbacteria bacterium]|nr:hypothetical protein [Candidatus Eisenbacteria bacterium]